MGEIDRQDTFQPETREEIVQQFDKRFSLPCSSLTQPEIFSHGNLTITH